MNLLFHLASLYTPQYRKKRELINLFRVTALAFEKTLPSISHFSLSECLDQYARFTASSVHDAISGKIDLKNIQTQLYKSAYEIGRKFREQFGISCLNDAMEASRLLYSILGIDFRGDARGAIAISCCFFSQYYSPDTCRVISSLDAGLIAGLSGGEGLEFSERITEGYRLCKAQILFKERLS